MNQYEAMFLFDPTFGNSFEKCEAEIHRLMERAQAEIIICGKWDERRLAYRIKGRKRGVYVLVYFKASPDRIVEFERDAKLSESILRVLVLRADHMTQEAMERQFPSGAAEPVTTDDVTGGASKPKSQIEDEGPADKDESPGADPGEELVDRADVPVGDEITTPEPVATETASHDQQEDKETRHSGEG